MKDGQGKNISNRQSIADVLAEFYEQLYTARPCEAWTKASDNSRIDPFTAEELAS